MIEKPKTILAGEVAGQLINQVNNLFGRIKHTLEHGVPANAQQGLPALSAQDIKEALGDALPAVERVVSVWSVAAHDGLEG